jgi:hypothetical protein
VGLFDGVQDAMFSAVTTTFGDIAIWTPLNLAELDKPAEPITGAVLLNSPSEVSTLFGIEYEPETVYLEFNRKTFEGLKESVDKKNPEPILFKGVNYWVKNIRSKYDGQCMIAELVKD